nr:hypothetical protein [Tanacetum cinerariifolium]
MLGIKCTRHSHCQLWSSHSQKKFPLPVKKVPTAKEKQCHCCEDYNATKVKKSNCNYNIVYKDSLSYKRSPLVIVEDVATTTGTTSDGTGKKKGRTVTLTTDDMQKRKNDVKARTTLLLSLPNEHQLRFNDLYNHLKVYDSEVQKKSEPNSQNMAFISSAKHSSGNEELNIASGSTASINVSTASANIGVASISQDTACAYIASQSSEFASMAKTSAKSEVFDNSLCSKACKKNSDSLNKLLKKEKDTLETKLTGFQTASKDLDSLLESQRLDKNKEGLGYSAIPPPPTQVYSPPKKDMSWTGLFKFKDDTVTDYSRPSPAIESTSDDAQNRNPSVTETEASPSTISPKPFIKFVKATDRSTEAKTAKVETAKPAVKYAAMYSKPSKSSKLRGNQRN